ncbi:MAG: type III-B CRISPR-associated protein Cas10/Cmr2 [Acinetobacter sp.]|nr:type III-B CRISPR-associated protein Cas10/Cmr2 [Acinetobacter sp.]
MTEYVVILAVGPVQSMIAAARKSRDLWSGSALLSELAKACALFLQTQGAELIFPAISKDDSKSLEKNSDFSVGNKIQVCVQVEDEQQLKSIVQQAKQATRERFLEEANDVYQTLKSSEIRSTIWNAQVNDYVEVQAAWAKINEKQPYADAVSMASKVLAARKATRDFSQISADPYAADFMIPKSSLDGARETVLQEDKKQPLSSKSRAKLGLATSEQLDCLGVVKRLGLQKQADRFTAFTRITAHAWIEKISNDENFAALKECYERLFNNDLATRVGGNEGIYNLFPYDAQFLYRSRLEAELSNFQVADSHNDALTALLNLLKKHFWSKYGEPAAYGVLLLADGDRMGELLDKASDKDSHKKITIALSEFADGVADIMRTYDGHCVYAGGDDVLGFVPLHQAYDCAKALSLSFKEKLLAIAQTLKAEQAPTLSVGLAITHHMTPLSVVREYASQAEKYAKGDHISDPVKRRNALGILLDVRSGNQTKLRFGWDDHNAHQAFAEWVNFYVNKSIPSRIAYDTRAIGLRTQKIAIGKEIQKEIQSAEFTLMLKKARLSTGGLIHPNQINQLVNRSKETNLQALSDELIVARWFAAKTQQDLGKDGQ